ncbi:MAG: hypothetical protein V1766_09415 [Pseudomonadota bacterium]
MQVNIPSSIRKYFTKRPGFEFWFILLLMYLSDRLVAESLKLSSVLAANVDRLVVKIEHLADILFGIILIAMCAAWIFRRRELLRRLLIGYTSFAMLHLIGNLLALVLSADGKRGQPLHMLWDVATVYLMNVVVFAVWYWIVDTFTPGGAFLFPQKVDNGGSRDEQKHPIDYLFLSFNVSSTLGPTIESVISRPAKLLMMLQTAISLTIIVVLAARAVSQIR